MIIFSLFNEPFPQSLTQDTSRLRNVNVWNMQRGLVFIQSDSECRSCCPSQKRQSIKEALTRIKLKPHLNFTINIRVATLYSVNRIERNEHVWCAQFLVTAVRLSESVTVSKIKIHVSGVDVVIRFQAKRQQFPHCDAKRPLKNHTNMTFSIWHT